MGITIKDIAIKCGVSVGTVDRALNNRSGISPKTKSKILKVAEELNYTPNFLAHSLAKGKTMTLGVVLFDLKNYFFTQLLQSIESKAKEHSYYIELILTNKDKNTEREAILHLVNRKVDGIILFTANKGEDYIHFLEAHQTPIVTIGNYLASQWTHIGINERRAMKEATSYVLQEGYEQLIFICPPLAYQNESNIYTLEERLKGLLDAQESYNTKNNAIPDPIIIKDHEYCQALEKLGLPFEMKTAIICISDLHALHILKYLSSKSIQVPQDIGLIGFDNLHILEFISPKLTTVDYPAKQMGEQAVESIVASITGVEIKLPPLRHTVVLGESL